MICPCSRVVWGGLAALAGVDLGIAGGTKVEAVALMKSRVLTESFLVDNELLPVLFEDAWDAKLKAWKSNDPDDTPTLARANKKFDSEVRSVYEDKKTGLITLSIEWTDPELAVVWSRDLVDRVNQQMRDRVISRTDRSLAYLGQELEKTDIVAIEQAIHSLVEKQIKTRMLASVQEEYAFQVIDPPALPDPKDRVSPKPNLMTLLGAFLGVLLGIGLALILEMRKSLHS